VATIIIEKQFTLERTLQAKQLSLARDGGALKVSAGSTVAQQYMHECVSKGYVCLRVFLLALKAQWQV
jgi:hypothetical protein